MKDLTVFDKDGKTITTILINEEDKDNTELLNIFKEHLGGFSYKVHEDGEYYLPETSEALFVTKPFDSWSWNTEFHKWEAPIPEPQTESSYEWSEENQNWIIL
jgi:hypothetical protein